MVGSELYVAHCVIIVDSARRRKTESAALIEISSARKRVSWPKTAFLDTVGAVGAGQDYVLERDFWPASQSGGQMSHLVCRNYCVLSECAVIPTQTAMADRLFICGFFAFLQGVSECDLLLFLWLRPAAAVGKISGVFSLRVSLEAGP
jgi:hypothetical protein